MVAYESLGTGVDVEWQKGTRVCMISTGLGDGTIIPCDIVKTTSTNTLTRVTYADRFVNVRGVVLLPEYGTARHNTAIGSSRCCEVAESPCAFVHVRIAAGQETALRGHTVTISASYDGMADIATSAGDKPQWRGKLYENHTQDNTYHKVRKIITCD